MNGYINAYDHICFFSQFYCQISRTTAQIQYCHILFDAIFPFIFKGCINRFPKICPCYFFIIGIRLFFEKRLLFPCEAKFLRQYISAFFAL